jgi:hypothetical protein
MVSGFDRTRRLWLAGVMLFGRALAWRQFQSARTPARAVARAKVSDEVATEGRSRFEAHLLEQMQTWASKWGVETLCVSAAKFDPDKAREQVQSFSALLQSHPRLTFDLNISSNFQVFATPYDHSWQVGLGSPLNQDGKPLIFGSDGFSGAGFAIDLTVSSELLVSIVPQGVFTGGWSNISLDAQPQRSLSGGTGVVVYSDAALLLSRTASLWNVAGLMPGAGQKFTLNFADTASPAPLGSFGSIPIAPVLVSMVPGVRYEVWFYVWQLNTPLQQGVLTFCEANIPLVTISAGPPIKLH